MSGEKKALIGSNDSSSDQPEVVVVSTGLNDTWSNGIEFNYVRPPKPPQPSRSRLRAFGLGIWNHVIPGFADLVNGAGVPVTAEFVLQFFFGLIRDKDIPPHIKDEPVLVRIFGIAQIVFALLNLAYGIHNRHRMQILEILKTYEREFIELDSRLREFRIKANLVTPSDQTAWNRPLILPKYEPNPAERQPTTINTQELLDKTKSIVGAFENSSSAISAIKTYNNWRWYLSSTFAVGALGLIGSFASPVVVGMATNVFIETLSLPLVWTVVSAGFVFGIYYGINNLVAKFSELQQWRKLHDSVMFVAAKVMEHQQEIEHARGQQQIVFPQQYVTDYLYENSVIFKVPKPVPRPAGAFNPDDSYTNFPLSQGGGVTVTTYSSETPQQRTPRSFPSTTL